ncbi:MAG: saccharopine dehydrogenase NADP-binding domain-containing protein [Acidobacteria bacterium]|nr:saccharopine dehydrogenase NADP-binding domain-containing protein [Acidobacteriota bacterium]
MRIFVLGAGATGSVLARLLARQGHQVWCGDRELERARRFLDSSLPVEYVNARNLWSIVRAARGCHLLVNAASAVFNQTVLRAALRLRAHYLDLATHLGHHPFKAEELRFHRKFIAKRRTAVINAGAAPGLTNLLVARAAELLERIEQVHIRLYEGTESRDPVSMWSAETAFDEAVSRPVVYRQGRFHVARRFGEAEWFRFPSPLGRVRVVLAAQDEVATLPHFIRMRDLDVKIGGNEIARLRRWYRQGKLRRTRRPVAARFPETLSPRAIARLIRRGLLRNARFGLAVEVSGSWREEHVRHGWFCTVPSLYQLRRRGLNTTPIAFATAHLAALFVKQFPRGLSGVYPPEALPAELRRAILRDLKGRGFNLTYRTRCLPKPEDPDEEW